MDSTIRDKIQDLSIDDQQNGEQISSHTDKNPGNGNSDESNENINNSFKKVENSRSRRYSSVKKSYKNNSSVNDIKDNDDDSDSESTENGSKFNSIPISVVCPFVHYKKTHGSSELQEEKSEVNKRYLFTTLFELESHLENEHNAVFANLKYNILFMQEYLNRYADTFNSQKISEVARKVLRTEILKDKSSSESQNNDSTNEPVINHDKEIFYIDPIESEFDKSVREEIQKKNLNEILELQIKERNNEAKKPRKCLFCEQVCTNRSVLFSHMFKVHGFNIGLPDNLVKTETFLNTLEDKLNNLQCLNCEKEFTSAMVLRKHMRKKKHFKISSRNHFFDQFYIVNYSEPGKDWEKLDQEKYESGDEGNDNQWDDWVDEEAGNIQFYSLFDKFSFSSFGACLKYMKSEYNFDLELLQSNYEMDFYKIVALINYIRIKTKDNMCYQCDLFFGSSIDFAEHLKTSTCVSRIPPSYSEVWANPKYLIPALENDMLVSSIDYLLSDNEE
ncbi:Zinc finger protein [Smittium culicis]|uniref:Zinc finger protein n=1 Tax=Smittium culicis TaxID=133412 RepID=A0A1R1YG40_9FUNG|nr:Zinc finger protein [Smittium culicis]